jgi:transposase
MQFIQGTNRNQTYFTALEEQVASDNPIRIIDAFVDKLDLQKLGLSNTVHKSEGRPPYAAELLLKLYLDGYLNKIRSSRKLEQECRRNMELRWLMQELSPNYHTISDFRKEHSDALKNLFKLYV